MGVSLSAMGLRVDGERVCPQGGGHKVSPGVLTLASQHGSAEGRCEACKQMVRVVRA